MYAVFTSGNKQYKVNPGDLIRVEKIKQNIGYEFNTEYILALGGEEQYIGTPYIANAKIDFVITKQAKAKKVLILKKKRRKGYRCFKGHRQQYTELLVKQIIDPNGQIYKKEEPIADTTKTNNKAKTEKNNKE